MIGSLLIMVSILLFHINSDSLQVDKPNAPEDRKVLIKGHWGDGYLSVCRVFTQFTTFQLMTMTLVSKKSSRADEDSTGRLANQRLLNAHYC